MVLDTEKMEELMDKVYSVRTVQAKLVVLHTEKMEELMDMVYSASTVHISGAAYREKMKELMGKVYSASTGHISGEAYGENGGTNGQGLQCKYRPYLWCCI